MRQDLRPLPQLPCGNSDTRHSPHREPTITFSNFVTGGSVYALTLPTLSQLSAQGSPFSDPGFSAPGLRWAGVPVATLPFLVWRTMGDAERLAQSYEAYAAFDAFLQLVWDDQDELCPDCTELLAKLVSARTRTRGLLANLVSIMASMGIPASRTTDILTSEAAGVAAFERKCRGYVVCREYHGWVDRTVRDFTLCALPVGSAMDLG
uniref:Uncharacterized protein n=1 Tax=Pelusios castaneus TaxID=367368 RepID=A0A8C8SFL9_9SAUR